MKFFCFVIFTALCLLANAGDVPTQGEIGTSAMYYWNADTQTLIINGTGSTYNYEESKPPPFWSEDLKVKKLIIESGITGIGKFLMYSACASSSSFESVEIANSVQNIGYLAFKGCKSLKTLTLPDSVTSIGYYAFAECSNLESITFANKSISIQSSAFQDCSSLKSLFIPDAWTSVDPSVFYGCSNLATISVNANHSTFRITDGILFDKSGSKLLFFPPGKEMNQFIFQGISEIGPYAFCGCSKLSSVVIEGVKKIGNSAFESCTGLTSVVIRDDVNSIGENVFSHCTSLSSIKLPKDMSSIPPGFCSYCSSLVSITLPKDVYSIGYDAFSDSGLTSFTSPRNMYSFGSSAFYNCTNLKSVVISDAYHPVTFGGSVFGSCKNLISFTYWPSIKPEGEHAGSSLSGCESLKYVSVSKCFDSDTLGGVNVSRTLEHCGWCGDDLTWDYDNETFVLSISGTGEMYSFDLHSYDSISPWRNFMPYITSVVFDKGPTSVGKYAFRKYNTLKSVDLSDSVKWIDTGAFWECRNLETIKMSKSMTSIGQSAFAECEKLTNLTLPPLMQYIGISAFQNCKSLRSLVIPIGVSSIARFAFLACSGLKSLVLPAALRSVGIQAFFGCSSLESIIYRGMSEPSFTYQDNFFTFSSIKVKNVTVPVCYKGDTFDMYGVNKTLPWDNMCGPDAYYEYDDENGVLVITGGKMYDFNDSFIPPWSSYRDSITAVIFNGISSIGTNSFEGCSSLTSVDLDEVSSIGSNAFANCSNLETVRYYRKLDVKYSGHVFDGCDKLKCIIVPTEYNKATFCEKNICVPSTSSSSSSSSSTTTTPTVSSHTSSHANPSHHSSHHYQPQSTTTVVSSADSLLSSMFVIMTIITFFVLFI